MAINTTPQKKGTGGLHTTTATAINDLEFPTYEREDKAFSTLRAAYALHSQALHGGDPAYGPVTYWAERWGHVRHLPIVDAARRFLEQIGGHL